MVKLCKINGAIPYKKHIENQYENEEYQDEDEDGHFMQSVAV